jgi:hypothetical protein
MRCLGWCELLTPGDEGGREISAGEVQSAAFRFMQGLARSEHSTPESVGIAESFIARPGDPEFTPGSWVLVMELSGDAWTAVRDGIVDACAVEVHLESVEPVVYTDGGSSPIQKHLPGRHDQKTHGNRRGGRLAKLTEEFGGVTYSLLSNTFPNEGFALSIYPEHERIIDGSQTYGQLASEINDYLKDKKELLAKPDHHIGIWRSPDQQVYFDISVVVTDQRLAGELAAKHKQLAYYDLKRGETVEVERSED